MKIYIVTYFDSGDWEMVAHTFSSERELRKYLKSLLDDLEGEFGDDDNNALCSKLCAEFETLSLEEFIEGFHTLANEQEGETWDVHTKEIDIPEIETLKTALQQLVIAATNYQSWHEGQASPSPRDFQTKLHSAIDAANQLIFKK
jgi:hypothetical protein